MSDKVIIVSVVILLIIIMTIIFLIYRKKEKENIKKLIEALDRDKNMIETAPILSELAKMETIIKNDKIEEKYNAWKERFENIKEDNVNKINDMVIDLDLVGEKKRHKEYIQKIAQTEIEIAKAKFLTDTLLDEIKEITLSEEKYRSIIIKLKTRYRELFNSFDIHKKEYGDISEIIELQFENIEKRFQDFEDYMEKSDYQEVFHIVKGIDIMIDHMGIVINEVPDLVLLANKLIPKRIEQITEVYEQMEKENYPLSHLKIEYNVEESLKNVNSIIDRIKVLNLENCMFELKTMLEYLDSLFNEFELEKNARKNYVETKEIFDKKLDKILSIISDIYLQIDDIKNMYDLTEKDVKTIDDVNTKVNTLNMEYDNTVRKLEEKTLPYSAAYDSLESYLNILKNIEDELDIALKNLGNMYEDEERAREQLDEIQELLKQSKAIIRSYKLPIVSNNYFVELEEANDAILEIIKELEKKPITIKTLNTRVDTARDLVLKLFNTTRNMVKLAKTVESLIIYGNRYRSDNSVIDSGLNRAQMLFYKGEYRKALDFAIVTIEKVDNNIKEKVGDIFEKAI